MCVWCVVVVVCCVCFFCVYLFSVRFELKFQGEWQRITFFDHFLPRGRR